MDGDIHYTLLGEENEPEMFFAYNNGIAATASSFEYEESEYYHMAERKTGGMSNDQFNYYKAVLSNYKDVKWTFVLMHKPLWMREDEKGLGKLESLLADRPYTVINGHFHSLSHHKRHGRDYTILGTTGGSQNPTDSMAFDHITLVRMAKEPIVTHLKMDGILDETGKVPVVLDSLFMVGEKN